MYQGFIIKTARRMVAAAVVVAGLSVLLAACGEEQPATTTTPPGATSLPGATVVAQGSQAPVPTGLAALGTVTPVPASTQATTTAGGAATTTVTTAPATTQVVSATQPVTTQAVSATAVPPANIAAVIQTQLGEAWQDYSKRFIQDDGRVKDPMQTDLTTSEGQSYALLRSVWQDDRDTFKRALSWSQSNLQTRGRDKLFGFKWGKAPDDSWKILDDSNASDADSDIALALIMAWQKWNDESYQKLALEILTSLWDKSVVTVQGKPYLTAGDWAPAQDRPALNPSYLSPYAYRVFSAVDPAHNWARLVDTSYEVIKGCSEAELGGQTGPKLPPNWCGIDKQTGKLTVAQDYPSLNTNYGYDAFRTMWRLALDYKWYGEKRALEYLTASKSLRDWMKQNGKLAAEYDFSGKPLESREDLAIYGGSLGNFIVADRPLADAVVTSKLLPAYKKVVDNDFARAFAGWGDSRNYYNQNWVWFGLALYADSLPNLAATVK